MDGAGRRADSVPSVRSVGGAIRRAELDALFLGVSLRGFFDDRPQQLPVWRDPTGDHLPLLAVPLLERHAAVAFVIIPGHIDRVEKVLGAERLDPRRIELEMLEAPADFVAGQCAVTVFLLRNADGFDIKDAVDDAEIVIDAADAL